MASRFFFSLGSIKPKETFKGGTLTEVTSKEVPGFAGISFVELKLNPKGSVQPIWHPNSHKIGYCTEGKALVSIRAPHSFETFTVKTGDMFFIPQGYIHHIMNIGDKACQIHFALSASIPETMHLSKAIESISDSVFNSTFNTPSGFVKGLKAGEEIAVFESNHAPEEKANPYKFNIGGSEKVVLTKGGYLQIGTKTNLPTLSGLGILGFGLKPHGIVEPHWHTNAGELVYIVKGTTRITVLAPDGKVDIMEVKGGEGAFAPASYFHNIENIGQDDVEVIAFFTHQDPDYIGIGEAVGAFSNELLGSVFNTSPDYFKALKKTEKPLIIVPI